LEQQNTSYIAWNLLFLEQQNTSYITWNLLFLEQQNTSYIAWNLLFLEQRPPAIRQFLPKKPYELNSLPLHEQTHEQFLHEQTHKQNGKQPEGAQADAQAEW
jgi:hypothetical protein